MEQIHKNYFPEGSPICGQSKRNRLRKQCCFPKSQPRSSRKILTVLSVSPRQPEPRLNEPALRLLAREA